MHPGKLLGIEQPDQIAARADTPHRAPRRSTASARRRLVSRWRRPGIQRTRCPIGLVSQVLSTELAGRRCCCRCLQAPLARQPAVQLATAAAAFAAVRHCLGYHVSRRVLLSDFTFRIEGQKFVYGRKSKVLALVARWPVIFEGLQADVRNTAVRVRQRQCIPLRLAAAAAGDDGGRRGEWLRRVP